MSSTSGLSPNMLPPARRSWRRCCAISPAPVSPLPPRLEENEMAEVASQDYRDAMACLGAAVNIVTTDGRAGRAGFTASAYSSVTKTGVVCVNVLSARHERLSRLFSGRIPVDERFAEAVWSTLGTGA